MRHCKWPPQTWGLKAVGAGSHWMVRKLWWLGTRCRHVKTIYIFFYKSTCLHHRLCRPYGPHTLPLLTCGGSTMPLLPLAHQTRVRKICPTTYKYYVFRHNGFWVVSIDGDRATDMTAVPRFRVAWIGFSRQGWYFTVFHFKKENFYY